MELALLLVALIGLAVATGIWLVTRDRGRPEPVAALWEALGFGALGVVGVPLIYGLLPNMQSLTNATTDANALVVTILIVATVEELVKFVPLALFMWRRPYFNEHTDGVIYFGLAGLAFGLGENLLYSLAYGVEVGSLRLLLLPFFQASLTALVGYALIRVKLRTGHWIGVVAALLGAIALHAGYDWLATLTTSSGLAAGLLLGIIINVGLFALYAHAARLDRLHGLIGRSHRHRAKLEPHRGGLALAALGLAILSLPLAIIPIVGWAVSLVAVVAATLALNSTRHTAALWAIVIGSLGFTLAVGWFGILATG